jgi:hypothetical protein
MDVYFKEKQKMPKSVNVESEMPLISHLIEKLGLVFKGKQNQLKNTLDEEDQWDSEEEEDMIGIRPRRRRASRLRDLYDRRQPVIQPIRQPVIRRMMTRSRAREHERNNVDIQRIGSVVEESLDESEEDVEICRRRMRTRNKYRLEDIENEDEEVENGKEVHVESSIGAKAGERRRRNNQRNYVNSLLNNDESERRSSIGGELSRKTSVNKNIIDLERNNETPGRIINSFDENLSKRKRFCFECSQEIHCRKKKRKCSDCDKYFHLNECMDEGMIDFNSDWVCLICYLERKKNDKQFQNSLEQNRFKLDKLNRSSFGNESKHFLNQEKEILEFEFIEGDEIILIPRIFKEFVKHYSSVLPANWSTQNLDLLLKMEEDLKVTILDISFELPSMRTKTQAEKYASWNDLPLFQILKLKIIDSNVNELRTKYNLKPIPNTGKTT